MDPSRVIHSAFTPELNGNAGIKFSPLPLQSTRCRRLRRRRTIQAFNRPTIQPTGRQALQTDRQTLAHSLGDLRAVKPKRRHGRN